VANVSPNSRSLQRSQQRGFAVRFCNDWIEDTLRPLRVNNTKIIAMRSFKIENERILFS
jgi:hypothetical protein